MKKADCALSVVPVLAMIGRPSLMAAAVPVPSTVSYDIAYWTWESWAGVSTWVDFTWACLVTVPWVICWMTCAAW